MDAILHIEKNINFLAFSIYFSKKTGFMEKLYKKTIFAHIDNNVQYETLKNRNNTRRHEWCLLRSNNEGFVRFKDVRWKNIYRIWFTQSRSIT